MERDDWNVNNNFKYLLIEGKEGDEKLPPSILE